MTLHTRVMNSGMRTTETPSFRRTLDAKPKTSAASLTPADLAKQWGLIGVWGKSCSRGISVANPATTYSVNEKGQLVTFSTVTYAGGVLSDITEAKAVEGNQLELTFIDPARGRVRKRTVALDGGKLRVMTSSEGGAAPTVVNGVVTKTKKPTPALTRCKANA